MFYKSFATIGSKIFCITVYFCKQSQKGFREKCDKANIPFVPILTLVGFGRACAPVRCAHPSFWAH